jgi:uncharacterized protein (DUF302 family)
MSTLKGTSPMPRRFAALAFALFLAAPAAAENGMVTVPSRYPVVETIDRFEAAAKADKFVVFARVDFQSLATANGGAIRPNQLLIFGRGGVVPPLLPGAPVAAIDLPLKALAWEDANGKVWLTYNTGEYLKERHGVSGKDELLKRLTDATAALAKQAAE